MATFAAWSIGAGFDPAKTWGICPSVNAGYPFLTLFHSSDPCAGGPGVRSTAPPPAFQGLPMPASGSCDDVDDRDYSYGTGVFGGWSRAWQPWVRVSPEAPSGGWACVRILEYNVSRQAWQVQGAN